MTVREREESNAADYEVLFALFRNELPAVEQRDTRNGALLGGCHAS